VITTVSTGRAFAALGEALGPIADLLHDAGLTEIMVNGPNAIYVERDGRILLTDRRFTDENHLLRAIDALASTLGRQVTFGNPVLEARLPEGSRLTVALPPVAIDGPVVAIRKFSATPYQMEDLVRFGSLSVEAAGFLRACVMARANLLISGGASSGKTTLLNALSRFVADDQRIVTIEEAAELRLQQHHVCRLESLPTSEAVTIRQLVKLAVRMRPDRILIGEVRGAEALDLLQAMNAGHDGSMTTIHANNPRDALSRLETLVLMGGLDLPIHAIRQQLLAVVDLVVHLGRLADGSRRVIGIAELTGMEGPMITMQDVFKSELAENGGSAQGGTRLLPTGISPRIMDKIHRRQVAVPEVGRLFPRPRVPGPIEARRNGSNPVAGGPPARDRRQR